MTNAFTDVYIDSNQIDELLLEMNTVKRYIIQEGRKRRRGLIKQHPRSLYLSMPKQLQQAAYLTHHQMPAPHDQPTSHNNKNSAKYNSGDSSAPVSPSKTTSVSLQQQHHKFFSTFVNIKDARYQISPGHSDACGYNFKNLQFPDIAKGRNKKQPQNNSRGSKKNSVSPDRNRQRYSNSNPYNSPDFGTNKDVFSQSLVQKFSQGEQKQIKRSQVKQSWNRYINMNNINKSLQETFISSNGSYKGTVYRRLNKIYQFSNGQGGNRRNQHGKDKTEQNIEGWKSFYHNNNQDEIHSIAKN